MLQRRTHSFNWAQLIRSELFTLSRRCWIIAKSPLCVFRFNRNSMLFIKVSAFDELLSRNLMLTSNSTICKRIWPDDSPSLFEFIECAIAFFFHTTEESIKVRRTDSFCQPSQCVGIYRQVEIYDIPSQFFAVIVVADTSLVSNLPLLVADVVSVLCSISQGFPLRRASIFLHKRCRCWNHNAKQKRKRNRRRGKSADSHEA